MSFLLDNQVRRSLLSMTIIKATAERPVSTDSYNAVRAAAYDVYESREQSKSLVAGAEISCSVTEAHLRVIQARCDEARTLVSAMLTALYEHPDRWSVIPERCDPGDVRAHISLTVDLLRSHANHDDAHATALADRINAAETVAAIIRDQASLSRIGWLRSSL